MLLPRKWSGLETCIEKRLLSRARLACLKDRGSGLFLVNAAFQRPLPFTSDCTAGLSVMLASHKASQAT